MEIATRSWFEGAWSIARTIDDRRAGESGRLQGDAVFAPKGDELEYRENGILEIGGRVFPAERRYLWRFEPNGRIRVLFDDGRPFHSFFAGQPVSDHLCGDDRYSVDYEFRADFWRSRWEVVGPVKDYVMVTEYRRREE